MSGHSDVVVVGSGASGVAAAQALLELGRSVLMLDVGHRDDGRAERVPAQSFQQLRRTDPNQHHYLLGDDFSGVDLGAHGAIAQLMPPRQFVFSGARELLESSSAGILAVESLARGGLAEAWGAVATPYLPIELKKSGLAPDSMTVPYAEIVERIGVSGAMDDLSEWRGAVSGLQPPLDLDRNAAAMLARYQQQRTTIRAMGFRVGQATMAVLSQSLGPRQRNPMWGTDFLANHGLSVFRPSILLATLRQHPRFSYQSGCLVTSFSQRHDDQVSLEFQHMDSGEIGTEVANQVILAAGTLGTSRIVLRSLDQYDVPVPLVCNEHTYIPSIRWRGFGSHNEAPAHSLAQLTMMHDPTGDQAHLVQAQSYSFTGLPLARLLKATPLSYRESRQILQILAGSLVILVTQHEDEPAETKFCCLRRGGSALRDVLEVSYRHTSADERAHSHGEARMRWLLRRMGCQPLRTMRQPVGSSVHYAGTLAATQVGPLSVEANGQLRGASGVFIADGAGLAYLPAKGLTLTLMANARRIAVGLTI